MYDFKEKTGYSFKYALMAIICDLQKIYLGTAK